MQKVGLKSLSHHYCPMRESRGSKSQIGPFVRQPENSVLRGVPGANADPLACAPSERVVVQDPRIICQLLQVANRDPDARWPCKPNGAYRMFMSPAMTRTVVFTALGSSFRPPTHTKFTFQGVCVRFVGSIFGSLDAWIW